jgi:hypothetical protein
MLARLQKPEKITKKATRKAEEKEEQKTRKTAGVGPPQDAQMEPLDI